MKRTGCGSGEWQVISWEQAYKEIAEKMTAIKTQHGPQGVVFLLNLVRFQGIYFNWRRLSDHQTPLRTRRHAQPENRLPPK
jgi:anaerobic selenocysteine-containing dehydrogenase